MRVRILEVPSLLDYTLLREPRRGVAVLANVSRELETDADGAIEGATVQDSRDNAEANRMQQCEKHRSIAPVQDGTESCVTV